MAQTLTLSDLTYDFDQFVAQLEQHATTKGAWKGTLTIQTSQTLLEFAAAIGVYIQTQINRALEDAFSETAQSDEAIRANITFQGVRLTRKLPAAIEVELVSPTDQFFGPYTQFTAGGNWFNRDNIVLTANVPKTVTLFQGEVQSVRIFGLGTNHQTYTTPEDGFVVSDQDTLVLMNGAYLPKAKNAALWNYRNTDAYADLTLENGRMLIHFGNVVLADYVFDRGPQWFGTIPGVNDEVTIQYVVTEGARTNNKLLKDNRVSIDGNSNVAGKVLTNPSGGADEREPYIYKNVIAGAFGTYESAVTANQYKSTVVTYPGLVDAVTQAQRDINPMNVHWMNVIRVSGLPATPWVQAQKDDFCRHMEQITMYSTRFVWQDPIPMDRDVFIELFVYNSADPAQVEYDVREAIKAFFSPRQGLLSADFFESDITQVVKKACKGQMAYLIDYSAYPMYVGAPKAVRARTRILNGQGVLTQMQYAYSVAVTLTNGDVGAPDFWVFPQVLNNGSAVRLEWDTLRDVASIRIYGRRSGDLGLLATIPGTATSYVDDGATPAGATPIIAAGEFPIRYNRLRQLTLKIQPATRQQRIFDDK